MTIDLNLKKLRTKTTEIYSIQEASLKTMNLTLKVQNPRPMESKICKV